MSGIVRSFVLGKSEKGDALTTLRRFLSFGGVEEDKYTHTEHISEDIPFLSFLSFSECGGGTLFDFLQQYYSHAHLSYSLSLPLSLSTT